jgi:hypothetical protein
MGSSLWLITKLTKKSIATCTLPKYIHPCHVHSQLQSSMPCQLPSTFIHAMQTLRTVIHSGTIPSTFIHTSTLISTYIHSSMVWKQRAHFEGHFQLENSIGIWGRSCNSIKESDLIEFNSQFSELRCERY